MHNPYLKGLNNVKELKHIFDENGYSTLILSEGKAMDLLVKKNKEVYIIEVKGRRDATEYTGYGFYSSAMRDIINISNFIDATPLFIYNYNGAWYVLDDLKFLIEITKSEKRVISRKFIDMKNLSISLDDWMKYTDGERIYLQKSKGDEA